MSLVVLGIFVSVSVNVPGAEARSSAAWKERLDARTTTLWIKGQALGDSIVLNARGELEITWVGRDLIRHLERDRDVEEWLTSALGYYFSSRKDRRTTIKGRDVFVLNYRAVKYWDFDPTRLVVGGYVLTSDDILMKKEYWQIGELSPGYVGTLAVVAPSLNSGKSALKPGQKIELRYEDTQAVFEAPREAPRR
jgi:hypothetical protein